MPIALKRAYEKASQDDGYRVLVDRLWPRGVAKADAQIDDWLKSASPSPDLRRAFHEGQLSWGTFRQRYLSELTTQRETLRALARRARHEKVTLVFSARDEKHNNAVVLKQYLEMLDK